MEIAPKQVLPNNFLKHLLSTKEILYHEKCLFIEGDWAWQDLFDKNN
jgi:hypothetical protein